MDHPRQHAQPRRRPMAVLLVLALLLAHALGAMHRVAHADGPHAHAGKHAGHALAADLFDAHHDQADCRLFDQLTQSDAGPTAAGPAAEALPGTPPGRVPKELPASSVPADCRARGPPQA